MSIVTAYSRQGHPLGQLRTSVTMSWAINGLGEATFPIANMDAKAEERLLEFGNYLTIDQGKLPLWGGVIDPDRAWDGSVITVKAYSGEYLLSLRGTDERDTLQGVAGDIFEQLIARANKPENLLIRPGTIYRDKEKREEELGNTVLEHVQAVAERADNDFRITPKLTATGVLYFTADWYKRLGEQKSFVLREGTELGNMERTPGRQLLVERGPIVNELTGLGDASTEGTRLRSTKNVPASISKYGLRTATQTFDGVTEQGTLDQSTRESVNVSAWPLRVFYVTALDVGDLYDQLDLGHIGHLDARNVGFQAKGFGLLTKVRILGMRHVEATNRTELTLEEQT